MTEQLVDKCRELVEKQRFGPNEWHRFCFNMQKLLGGTPLVDKQNGALITVEGSRWGMRNDRRFLGGISIEPLDWPSVLYTAPLEELEEIKNGLGKNPIRETVTWPGGRFWKSHPPCMGVSNLIRVYPDSFTAESYVLGESRQFNRNSPDIHDMKLHPHPNQARGLCAKVLSAYTALNAGVSPEPE